MAKNDGEKTLVEVLLAGMAGIGGKIAWDVISRRAAEFVEKKVHEKFVDEGNTRGLLLKDMSRMDPEKTINLRRRIAEAQTANNEDTLIELLCKIPYDATDGRRPELEYLNGLSDEEFAMAVNLLKHDAAIQWARRIKKNGGRIVARDFEAFRRAIGRGFGELRSTTKTIADRLEAWADGRRGAF